MKIRWQSTFSIIKVIRCLVINAYSKCHFPLATAELFESTTRKYQCCSRQAKSTLLSWDLHSERNLSFSLFRVRGNTHLQILTSQKIRSTWIANATWYNICFSLCQNRDVITWNSEANVCGSLMSSSFIYPRDETGGPLSHFHFLLLAKQFGNERYLNKSIQTQPLENPGGPGDKKEKRDNPLRVWASSSLL